MVNINYGRNHGLLDDCKPLNEYAWLIAGIRERRKDMDIEKAVDQAISEMPEDFVLKDFLMAHRAEVKGMMLTEYNEAETNELFKRDGKMETLVDLVKKGLLSVKDAADQAGLSSEAFQKLLKE